MIKKDARRKDDIKEKIIVSGNTYFGNETIKAIQNFPISNLKFQTKFIKALCIVKIAACRANRQLDILENNKAESIEKAAWEVVEGYFDNQFIVDVFQTGSGTSTNMNINEDVFTGSMGTPDETFEDEEFMVSVGEQLDMIGDGPDDLEHGTFEDDETEMLVSPEGEMEMFVDDDKDDFNEIDITSMFEEIEEEKIEPLQEQINKTLDMFKRFKNL